MAPEAITMAKTLQGEHPEWANLPLRLYIEGKGCDGFYYGISFDPEAPGDEVVLRDDAQGLRLIVDADSLQFVDGAHIVWVDNESGKGFLVENPQQRAFRGKFYKRSSWQKKLVK
jgi:iron-sulfur cluster assembly accessory protein